MKVVICTVLHPDYGSGEKETYILTMSLVWSNSVSQPPDSDYIFIGQALWKCLVLKLLLPTQSEGSEK